MFEIFYFFDKFNLVKIILQNANSKRREVLFQPVYFHIFSFSFVCFQGNCGDSRSITSVAGVAQELSHDHKPSNEGNFLGFANLFFNVLFINSKFKSKIFLQTNTFNNEQWSRNVQFR